MSAPIRVVVKCSRCCSVYTFEISLISLYSAKKKLVLTYILGYVHIDDQSWSTCFHVIIRQYFFSFQVYTMNKFTDRACVYYRAWRESERTCTSSNRVKSSSRIICQLAKKSPLQKNTPKKKKKKSVRCRRATENNDNKWFDLVYAAQHSTAQ